MIATGRGHTASEKKACKEEQGREPQRKKGAEFDKQKDE